jgi:hypothetical protein
MIGPKELIKSENTTVIFRYNICTPQPGILVIKPTTEAQNIVYLTSPTHKKKEI